MRVARLIAVLLLPPLGGCATFPALDTAPQPGASQAAYPDLLPLDVFIARVPPPPETDPAAELAARAAALKARAAALRAADLSG
ncbi:hypothetical protein [Defluviimonas sp. SAOS-178_SWC]|uniref:hypothetical protein n=1 Tax=Defluviimonas sp. SAOS-178_SWC TaxID=3121287 RepID=UPI003222097E